MSIKISLKIKTDFDSEALEQNLALPLVRFKAKVKFRKGFSWTKSVEGIVDTGSPISLIPKFIWEEILYESLSSHNFGISGISPPDTSPVLANLVRVSCILFDKVNTSPSLDIRCYLVETNNIPLVIGILDILTEARLICDYKNNSAYLEF